MIVHVIGNAHWARRTLPAADHQQIAVVNPDREDWDGLIEFEPEPGG
jgi:hypothetical protein